LEGDLVIGNEVYGAGDYIRSSPGSSHAPYTNGGCRFFFHASMDDEYPEFIEASSL
jgi:ChrR Cupin-like domain